MTSHDVIQFYLCNIGIIALVDEATGYQDIRERDAVQKILDKFLKDDPHKWYKTFQDDFWHKLIKIKGYPSYMALKRPAFVGHWVNNIIYDPERKNKVSKFQFGAPSSLPVLAVA